jgi:deoxyribonuclease-4
MIHDSYLINMGSPDESKGKRAQHAFLDEYRRCEALGVPYLNFHPGSHTHPQKAMRDDRGTRDAALERITTHINSTLEKTVGFESLLVLENAAGQGTNVGITFTELAHILENVEDQSRMGVCIDTQHAWASGYDWVSNYSGVWDEFDSLISRDRLVGMHLNDSLSDCGSRVDRHANHGEGKLGEGVFRSLMQDSRLDGIAGYLETPGGPDRWKPEIARLRELAER